MKRKSKVLMILLVGVMSSTYFMGCQKSNTEKKNNSGKTEVELFSTKNAENTEILKTLIGEFENVNTDITVKITSPSDAGTVLKTRLTKNDIPDVLAMGGDATFAELQKAGVLEDLSSQSYVGNLQDSYKKMVTDLYEDEGLYGAPYATNASGVLYNKDIFEKAGVKVPKTWDEFIAAIEKLESAGIQPFELTFKDTWTCLPAWNSLAPDLQPTNFTDDRKKNKTTFADTHEEIAEKYLKILNYAQDDFMGTTYVDGNKAFAEGKAAMMINGNWAISEFKKTNPNMNVDMFAFPSSNDSSKNYVTSGVDVLFAVAKDSKVKEAANKFVQFIMEKENAEKYAVNQFAFSAVKGVEQKDVALAGVKADIEAGKVANFPDHYYPAGFDLATLLSSFSLNETNGMDEKQNINEFLKMCDEAYNTANVE